MAPAKRAKAAAASAEADASPPPPGTPAATHAGWLTVGETDAYDEPAPVPAMHVALLAVAVAPALVDVPPNVAIVLTPTLAILVGAWRSVKPQPPAEQMTHKDAMRFPLVGSCFLFGLFLLFKFLPKDLVNLVLTGYFVFLGVVAMSATGAPFVAQHLPRHLARRTLSLGMLKLPAWLSEPVELTASVAELVTGVGSLALCGWYCAQKHWLANNALGLAFSLQGIEHISLGSTQIGALLLCGLFFYDVFWVFCTPVMVTVAKSFDAPIKLLFPRGAAAAAADALTAAANATKADAVPAGGAEGVAPATPSRPFNMLGLGDIVVPGIFIALVLRMDVARAAAPPPAVPPRARYFGVVMLGYVVGLCTTIAVMNIFNAAQPALLYIVPALLGAVAARAVAAGELKAVAAWEEEGSGEEGEGQEGAASEAQEGDKVAVDSGGEGSADDWVKLPKSAKKAAAVEAKKAK